MGLCYTSDRNVQPHDDVATADASIVFQPHDDAAATNAKSHDDAATNVSRYAATSDAATNVSRYTEQHTHSRHARADAADTRPFTESSPVHGWSANVRTVGLSRRRETIVQHLPTLRKLVETRRSSEPRWRLVVIHSSLQW